MRRPRKGEHGSSFVKTPWAPWPLGGQVLNFTTANGFVCVQKKWISLQRALCALGRGCLLHRQSCRELELSDLCCPHFPHLNDMACSYQHPIDPYALSHLRPVMSCADLATDGSPFLLPPRLDGRLVEPAGGLAVCAHAQA